MMIITNIYAHIVELKKTASSQNLQLLSVYYPRARDSLNDYEESRRLDIVKNLGPRFERELYSLINFNEKYYASITYRTYVNMPEITFTSYENQQGIVCCKLLLDLLNRESIDSHRHHNKSYTNSFRKFFISRSKF